MPRNRLFRRASNAARIWGVGGNSPTCAKVKVESAAMIAHTDYRLQFWHAYQVLQADISDYMQRLHAMPAGGTIDQIHSRATGASSCIFY